MPIICWAVPTALLGCMFGMFVSKISVDVLEHADTSCLKEMARNVWVNLGVVTALLLSLLLAMAQADCPNDDCADPVSLGYILCVGTAIMFTLNGLGTCVISLTYVEPLDLAGTIRYFIANPAQVGAAALMALYSLLYTVMAIVLWIYSVYGVVAACLLSIVAVSVLLNLLLTMWDKSSFDPHATPTCNGKRWKEWAWPGIDDPREWPGFVRTQFPEARRMATVSEASGRLLVFLRLHKDMLALAHDRPGKEGHHASERYEGQGDERRGPTRVVPARQHE